MVLHTASAQDLANTLWALATLDVQPTQQWWAAFQVAVSAQLWGLSGAGTANLLWAAGRLQLQPQAQRGQPRRNTIRTVLRRSRGVAVKRRSHSSHSRSISHSRSSC